MPEAPKVTKPALDIPVPGSVSDNAAVLASHRIPDNSPNPIVFFDVNVGGNHKPGLPIFIQLFYQKFQTNMLAA